MREHPEILQILAAQHGVISRRQALQHISERSLDRRVRKGGRWQVVLPGVCGAFTGTPTETQRRLAAVLYAGHGAFITGDVGCREYGLRAAGSGVIEVAASRRVRSTSFVRIQRSKRPTVVRVRNGVPYASPARCVVDAALRRDRLDDVRALVAEAVRRGLCRISDIAIELGHAPKNGSAWLRQTLAEVQAGGRSAPECKQIGVLSASKVLPPLHYNCSLMGPDGWIADPDAYCEESGTAQEIDSVEFHIDPKAWKQTMVRRSRMVSYGVRVLEVPPSQLDKAPRVVRSNFERTHAIGLQGGPPPGLWVRCRPDCPLRKESAA